MSDPDRDDGTSPALLAIRAALHTNRHAHMCFDMVADLLGPAAHVETRNGGEQRRLFRRDPKEPSLLLPWPLVSMSATGRLGTVVNLVGPDTEPAPRPGRVPRLRGLGPGEIVLHDGPRSITVTYGEDGRWKETTRARDRSVLAGADAALATGEGPPVDRLARFLAQLDVARHGAGRVLLPEPLPAGVAGAWLVGMRALRRALFEGRLGPGPAWIVADGYAGTVLTQAQGHDEALATWRAEVERVRPSPPPPPAPLFEGPDTIQRTVSASGEVGFEARLTGPRADVEQPEPTPANTPAVLVRLPAPPASPPPWGTWVALLDAFGATVHAARRPDRDGFTLLGEGLVPHVDPSLLDSTLEALRRGRTQVPAFARPDGMPVLRSELVEFLFLDEDSHEPVTPHIVRSQRGERMESGDLDAGRLRHSVLQQRALA
jgi:hypothetical protein